MKCSVEVCIIIHMNVFDSDWTWWNSNGLLKCNGKFCIIIYAKIIHVNVFDTTKVCVIVVLSYNIW